MPETDKNKDQLFTMLEVAKIVGCSKSTVYRVVKDNHLRAKKKKGQAKLYDETLIKLVRTKIDDINSSKEPFQRISIETLQKQLDIKDKQIEQLNEQLKMAQINLNQSQQLALEQSKKIKELEAPKETVESGEKTLKKKSLFDRIFGI
ncbi:helix-turn-helix transcriptional regulator [Limosilactobacillus vaginalis]|uniref:helix-turn-helix transcriptional regulator n=1 Tax=Limosilactobacillus vaginalis TaxID=1633 RepID=UPI003F242455